MSSVATTADNSAVRKSLMGDDDENVNYKEEMNYLVKEVDTLTATLAEKNKEIEFWKSKAQDEADLVIADLQAKLRQALSEVHGLKEAETKTQSQIQNKYIEKSQHNKETMELKAKVNYLTSENERLNEIISSQLEAWETPGFSRADSRFDEDGRRELIGKLESEAKENERLEKIIQDNAIEILEWKNKYTEFEAENNKLKAQEKEHEEEISTLKKANEEMEKQLIELRAKKDRLEHGQEQNQEEHDKLVKSLATKKKDLEEVRAKLGVSEKKEKELIYLKERFQRTATENEDLHKTIVSKNFEIEELKLKCAEFDENMALISELEGKINKLNIEKDELVIRCNGRNEALKKQKEINQNLMTEINEVQANLRFVEQENNELRQVTEGYERMIEDLKNTVVKGEQGTYRVLSFDPDSLA